MLSLTILEEFNRFRNAPPGTSVCGAPSINLHFSQRGFVTACCFNRNHVLGIYPENSLDEIWNGQPIEEICQALDSNDLSKGCEKCYQQLAAQDFGGAHPAFYSHFAQQATTWWEHKQRTLPYAESGQLRPIRLEFNIHNSCNLQCVMCHGLASSAIRSYREDLPALPNPYDETFVDQLEPFLPYVAEADFMGGEPFLIPVYLQIWERIAQQNPDMIVCILTNGTILPDHIKTFLTRINCWIHVSIDSLDELTYESIRRGARFHEVMAHCVSFLELMAARGRSLFWRYCAMRQNWHEIPEVVRYCNERSIMLMFNQVDSPLNFSLHTLPQTQLQEALGQLRACAPSQPTNFIEAHNLATYTELIQRLQGFLETENRWNGLKFRLDISNAVIDHYTDNASTGSVGLPLHNEVEALTLAAKKYVTARLNVDQASATEANPPEELLQTVAQTREELEDRLTANISQSIAIYLQELIRTYSSVEGILLSHSRSVFRVMATFAETIGKHHLCRTILNDLFDLSPETVYETVTARTETEMLTFLLAQYGSEESEDSLEEQTGRVP